MPPFPRRHLRTIAFVLSLAAVPLCGLNAQVQPATDGPKPLSVEEAREAFRLPEGLRIDIVASEPLIEEPSGVCWDEHGRLYVSELHGYNLEGQYDIDALNRTGELDRVVRRLQANDNAKQAALEGTYGVIKQLIDDDGDGRSDRAIVFAEGLPPCYGIVPARGGIIAACAPHIIFLRDGDGDGRAEICETLFTGFGTGALERGINAPQWGPDNWIYFGGGHRGGAISGPGISEPVDIGGNDFRIRADGSAIEPITGSTHTFGFTFNETGHRFVATTSIPGIQVAPLPWRYLLRNPDVAYPGLQRAIGEYTRVFPLSEPHPWRVRRAEDPGFFKYYRDRYGVSDSDAGGYFTSGCAPFIHRDSLLPGEFRGHYLICEPAQNLIHRAEITASGSHYQLQRIASETRSEFLATTDSWFHPMNLQPGPGGSIYIVDFYREIIEDYSAVPRYLQQLYGLTNGMHHGRIWRLTASNSPPAQTVSLADATNTELPKALFTEMTWIQQTARRLLIERNATEAVPTIARFLLSGSANDATTINAIHTLEGLGHDSIDTYNRLWAKASPAVRSELLRVVDQRLADNEGAVREAMLESPDLPSDPFLLIQYALSLGEIGHNSAIERLARLAREHGDIAWMDLAILSSVHRRETNLLAALVHDPGASADWIETIVATIAARGDSEELRSALGIAQTSPEPGRTDMSRILESALKTADASWERIEIAPPTPQPADYIERLENRLPEFIAALAQDRDSDRGRKLFTQNCSTCHIAKGIGFSAGPDLDSEFQRAEETILRDILFPNEKITAGFETARLEMRRGADAIGIQIAESPTSITLRFPGGTERTFLRRQIDTVHRHPVSMMTPTLGETMTPAEIADIIAFLRKR